MIPRKRGGRAGDGPLSSHGSEDIDEERKGSSEASVWLWLLIAVLLLTGGLFAYHTRPMRLSSMFTTSTLPPVRTEGLRGVNGVQRTDAPVAVSQSELKASHIVSLEAVAIGQVEELRAMKKKGVVMETDSIAQTKISEAQASLRRFLTAKYGIGPYNVVIKIRFPESMLGSGESKNSEIIVELAPIDIVPYSVYFFLEKILNKFSTGAFHRNAGHVLQAMLHGTGSESFAWQEYSPQYPHKMYTLGYAGRPSGSTAIYISTVDNTRNHGPASQGSKTEADSCFGRVVKGKDVIKRMQQQPGAGGSGFIKDKKDFIQILSMELLPPGYAPSR